MVKILFVCHGNICRSPMAEFIFRDMAKRRGLTDVQCASAATSDEETGNGVYPPARAKLRSLGLNPDGKRAVWMTRADYDAYDLLIGMEARNVAAMKRLCGGDPAGKIRRLLDYSARPRDIADPWYTDDFDTACRDITEGCEALIEAILAGRA